MFFTRAHESCEAYLPTKPHYIQLMFCLLRHVQVCVMGSCDSFILNIYVAVIFSQISLANCFVCEIPQQKVTETRCWLTGPDLTGARP